MDANEYKLIWWQMHICSWDQTFN